MKTLIPALLALALTVTAAFAEDTIAPKGAGKDHPCMKIEQACSAAGYAKGQAKTGKGLFVNCAKPILEGKSVPGVTVDATTIQACKEIKAKSEHLRDKNMTPASPNSH